jgi:hypothetical protein
VLSPQRPTYGEPSTPASLSALHTYLDGITLLTSPLPPHRRLVQPIITPRFVPTCSDELLSALATVAGEKGLWVQSHMCESADQMEWVESTRGRKDEEVFDQVSERASPSPNTTELSSPIVVSHRGNFTRRDRVRLAVGEPPQHADKPGRVARPKNSPSTRHIPHAQPDRVGEEARCHTGPLPTVRATPTRGSSLMDSSNVYFSDAQFPLRE